jgi:hypothetical protein
LQGHNQNLGLQLGTFSSICHISIERTARAQDLPVLDPISGENILVGSHALINNNKDVFQTLSGPDDLLGNSKNGMIPAAIATSGIVNTQSMMNVAQEDPSLKRMSYKEGQKFKPSIFNHGEGLEYKYKRNLRFLDEREDSSEEEFNKVKVASYEKRMLVASPLSPPYNN